MATHKGYGKRKPKGSKRYTRRRRGGFGLSDFAKQATQKTGSFAQQAQGKLQKGKAFGQNVLMLGKITVAKDALDEVIKGTEALEIKPADVLKALEDLKNVRNNILPPIEDNLKKALTVNNK